MVTVKGGTRPPWVGLSAAAWVQVASGNAYNFPLYSHSLKSVLGFNQRQVTMLGVANDVGENVGILSGIVCNHAPPWAVLLIGAVACFLGYGVLWLAVSRTVEYMPYWLKMIPRTILMTFTQVVMIITYLLFASALDGTLYVATTILGICYGVQFSTMVPTASELFGLQDFGIIFNFMMIGNPLGALLFSALLAGSVYDNEATKQGGVTCYGPQCFRLTFLALAGVCSMGTMLSVVLTKRIKPVYEMLYAGGSFTIPRTTNH